MSRYADVNGLTISKIEKREPKPVLKQGVPQQAKDLLKKTDISYYKIPVEYEIKGNFLGYIKFKRSIAKSSKMLNFDKETISIIQNDSTGAIIAQGELTIVGIPDEFFKIIILITLIIFSSRAFADTQKENSELIEQVKEITKELENEKKPEVDTNRVVLDEDEVPLNDPFAGNEGQSSSTINPETGEERDELSLYNFKLTGLISGKDESYISLTNISGDVITLN